MDRFTVKFTVRNRTVNWLTKIGVKDGSTLVGSMYPSMPMVSKGWMATNAFFKAEQGIINIGLLLTNIEHEHSADVTKKTR